MLRKFFTAIFFATFFAASSAQATTEAGVQALRAGDIQNAYRFLQPQAVAGDAVAQFSLCGMYFQGQGGLPKSEAEAFQWCKLAAEQGHVEAAYNLALFYQKGDGVGQNFNEAMRWYQFAAEKGHKDAQFNLLQLYNANAAASPMLSNAGEKPVGIVPQMPKKVAEVAAPVAAVAAAAQPTPPPPASPPAAKPDAPQLSAMQRACLQAAQQGIVADNCRAEAPTDAPIAVPVPEVAAAPLPEVAPEVDVQKTIGWFETQAELGDLAAQNNLGVMYRRGSGVAQNPQKAFELFQKSAARGSPNGMLNLANMYKLGEGTEQNLELSYAWYNLAADRIPAGQMKQSALANIKEISAYLDNEQIGNALEYVTKLDETIPLEQ